MPPKRPRRASPAAQGLSAGERLKRVKLAGNDYLAWSWVGTEVTDAADITQEHRLATCGLSSSSLWPFCPNKYAPRPANDNTSASADNVAATANAPVKVAKGELEDDIIVISEDDPHVCDSKTCKGNPNCLNYLGQEKWENEDKARNAFMKVVDLGSDPTLDGRAKDSPIGLKNLGATCYANAFLQVWYQDLPFRSGVYHCEPSQDNESKFEESPIFQLQVTFAAMQNSKQSVFNPVKLVESLRLRTTEQQDAQEFSKLFMAHLDSEFQKQSNPALKSLISDQFQGKQVYTVVCSKCQKRSERESDFLELEVILANNAKLEDRLAASLEAEELAGDNQYLCSSCESLQDAKRYTELRELPPVLHFSLLRFVYDLNTMERKKSKHSVLFPKSLDMEQFLSSPADGNKKRKHADGSKYYLRGVLLHKGPSAYHGHYEAQIFDVKNQAWYQFNDEVVTKIGSLGPQPKSGSNSKRETGKAPKTELKPPKPKPRRKIIKGEGDIEIVEAPGSSQSEKSADDANYISSKDAYMLIYARSGVSLSQSTSKESGNTTSISEATVPPQRALRVVDELNDEQEKRCEEYAVKEAEAEAHFNETRRRVMDIYQSWSLSDNSEESLLFSRNALESWITRHIAKTSDKTGEKSPVAEDVASGEERTISNEGIVCSHGRLDPTKVSSMKRIKSSSYGRIVSEDGCNITPTLSPSDVCAECVKGEFQERLYSIEHPRSVARFDDVSQADEGQYAYWISKSWLKDWRMPKPRMHVEATDPPPDDPEYAHHVKCEHDGLTPNTTSRKRISPQGYEILRGLFPNWTTLSTENEVCAVCEAMVQISREDKRGAKIQAEDEKAKLKHMHDNALTGNTTLLENVPCALVPAQFIRAWKQWLFHPAGGARPGRVDTAQFLCEHELLTLDPNVQEDMDSSVAVIMRSDWDILTALYSCGPLIALENVGNAWIHEPAVCAPCRRERKLAFDNTELTIRILRSDDPIPTPENFAAKPVEKVEPPNPLITYGSKKVGNLRQSKRIRQTKELGRRKRLSVTPTTSVKQLKIQIQEELDIPTIAQRLYYQGRELEDNDATLNSLGVLANDTMDLREESENIDLLDGPSDSDVPKNAEGRGFDGTLLGYSSQTVPSSEASSTLHTPSPEDDEHKPEVRSVNCRACTYANVPDAFSCEMCETILGALPP